jgi:anti-sigma regulatory factor (Ser/Thr protein kinase)
LALRSLQLPGSPVIIEAGQRSVTWYKRMPTYSLTVTSELENLERIAQFIEGVAEANGIDESSAYAIQLAVDEACTNVMQYAYEGRKGQPVHVECRTGDGQCQVVIRDRGKAFDPAGVPAPDLTSSASTREVGGLGIYLMRKLMDDVRWRFDAKSGNEVTLVKRLPPRRPPQSAAAELAGA